MLFFFFGPWITASDSYRSRLGSVILLHPILPTTGSQIFIHVSTYHHQSAFLSPEITIAVRQVSGSALEKERKFSNKYSWSQSEFAKKNPDDEAEFQKGVEGIVKTKSPRARTFRAKSSKSTGETKVFEMNITLERQSSDNHENILSEPRTKHSEATESLPHPQLLIHP